MTLQGRRKGTSDRRVGGAPLGITLVDRFRLKSRGRRYFLLEASLDGDGEFGWFGVKALVGLWCRVWNGSGGLRVRLGPFSGATLG